MRYTDIKQLDRCDSQQLKYGGQHRNSKSSQISKQSNMNTQINQLLQKISATCADIKQRRQSPQPTIEAQNQSNKIRFITKQGKNQDQPHRPNVLSASILKRSKNKSQRSSVINSKYNKFNFEGQYFERNQQFYKYCTDQIVRVSNLNTNLQKNLQKSVNDYQNEKVLNQNLKTQNLKLFKQINEIKTKLDKAQDQLKILKSKLTQEQRLKVERSKNEISDVVENTRIYQGELHRYRKLLSEKQEQNNLLLNQIKALKIETFKMIQMTQEIGRLNKKIAELATRNQQLEGRAAGKSQAVDHLWSIKEIQYANIVHLIGKSKPLFQSIGKVNKEETGNQKEQNE